jgi:FixJ family two-component response regulator
MVLMPTVAAGATRRRAMHSEAGSPMVYVVDDDEAVRDSTRVVLESYGMTVRTFGSAQAFLDEVEEGATG